MTRSEFAVRSLSFLAVGATKIIISEPKTGILGFELGKVAPTPRSRALADGAAAHLLLISCSCIHFTATGVSLRESREMPAKSLARCALPSGATS